VPDRRDTNDSSAGPSPQTSVRETASLEDVRRQLVAAVRRLCPAWLANQQDDIVQAALIRIHRLATDESRTTFQASYVWKVAFSVTIDEIRRYRRRPEDALDAASSLELIQPTPGPEDRVLARESRAAIQTCLAGLAADRRAAVTLHLQGHTVPESSRLLGWPVKRVANLTYRGLEDLRRCLSAKGYKG
jgi:RNA polymerase sigma-70 factor (ECF subfamily)